MDFFTQWWRDIISPERLAGGLRALVIVAFAALLIPLARRLVMHTVGDRMTAQHRMMLSRIITAVLAAIAFTWALHELGFQLSVLLGAAGIVTVALGIASQTSLSNVISGLFLMSEQSFVVGDVVTYGDITGEVLSVDLLSVKLRTFDNLLVRIPNEALVKSTVTTLTRFPVRRFDMKIGVAYKEDLALVQRVMNEVADDNPLCLVEPAPLFIVLGFGTSSVDIQFSVWCKSENFLALKNAIQQEIKRAFDVHGIEIPFPHVTLYAGSPTGPRPLPVGEPPLSR